MSKQLKLLKALLLDRFLSIYTWVLFLMILSPLLHIFNIKLSLGLKLGFYFRIRACLSFKAKIQFVAATFMLVLDYGDCFIHCASSRCLRSLDSVYHGGLRFITKPKTLTHH